MSGSSKILKLSSEDGSCKSARNEVILCPSTTNRRAESGGPRWLWRRIVARAEVVAAEEKIRIVLEPLLSRQISTVPEFLGFLGVYSLCLQFVPNCVSLFSTRAPTVDVLIRGYQDPPPVSSPPPLLNNAFISPPASHNGSLATCCSHRKEAKEKENSGYNSCKMACGSPIQDLLLAPKCSDKPESPSVCQACLERLPQTADKEDSQDPCSSLEL